MNNTILPIVGVICDREIIGPHPFHITGDKYLQAIVSGSRCLPMLIPALANPALISQILDSIDGLLLTGAYSMVDPINYQNDNSDTDTKLDPARDQTSLPLIQQAIEKAVPLFGICRGFQEMNVAFGGSLHQKLHQVGSFIEHRENNALPLDKQYANSHAINIVKQGKLHTILQQDCIEINSLHTQGVNRLASNLKIEAQAEDGLIEAFSVKDANAFALAVQWHPEWKFQQNKHSVKLFQAFGEACLLRKKSRTFHG